MSVQERAIAISGSETDMLGIVSMPSANEPAASIGVLIVVGGDQYRVGSHRQFVLLARHLAAHSYPVLRFDFPGMGDSPGELVSFEHTTPHIKAAIDAFQDTCPDVQRVVLWGLCDGASASLLYLEATQDPRVVGLALLNPWVRSEAGLARAQVKHYYRQRLLEPAFWHKLLVGGVGWPALRSLGSKLRTMRSRPAPDSASFQERMAQAWRAFPGPILLLLSQRDLTAQEFHDTLQDSVAWKRNAPNEPATPVHLLGADHTCSQSAALAQSEAELLSWLQRLS
jgi:exosortase A-associated hydrolase 1